ncbi:MAG: transketolase [Chloroflexi bacterium]|nr:transketolase [Chloroflexota bacterium]MCH8195958.1 transketolase [Chloroflexota bacterium]MCH8283768.1 transketolase [Chloroflexota bacterium]MCI0769147.1 transketolase [Chloroflexota bacterium]
MSQSTGAEIPASQAASASPAGAGAVASLAGNPANLSVAELEAKAKVLRRHIVTMTTEAGSGHPGGSLSAIDLMAAIYFRLLRHDPRNPKWPDRDRFVLSKGHCCPALYAVLAEAGYFPVEELATFRRLNSRLQGHAHIKTPGVEMSSGSLGQGLSFAIGTALAGRLDGRGYKTYVMLGDGECDEGQVWEAAMAASHYRLENIIAILDRNGIQNDRRTDEVMELEPLDDKWRANRWRVEHVDGHDMAAIVETLERVSSVPGPTVVIAKTVKGKGVSFMENNPAFHGKAANEEQLAQALAELA